MLNMMLLKKKNLKDEIDNSLNILDQKVKIKKEKPLTYENINKLLKGMQKNLNAYESKFFQRENQTRVLV